MLHEFLPNVLHNLFKPLLLFFYAGFLVPILGVKLEFPKAAYQALTIYLLLAIGWHGGEELADLEPALYLQAAGFMVVGFCTNALVAIVAYYGLRWMTSLRQIDAATVAGYYGSDSAGTFVTCLGVLTAAEIAFAPYMPVMLAVMEVPGCLVALYLVSQLRQSGMDAAGNMPDEPGYCALPLLTTAAIEKQEETRVAFREKPVLAVVGSANRTYVGNGADEGIAWSEDERKIIEAEELEEHLALQHVSADEDPRLERKSRAWLNREMLHEVFLNPGIFLLFAGIAIGFISRLQGSSVTVGGDALFNTLFQGCLCLFLLEMGITASNKLRDLRIAGWRFVLFALLAPNVFATLGIVVAHLYSLLLGEPFELGTYVLFAVLCGGASYIAVPAVQRLAIPEASPTLPLAASLGVTFSYNVTIGIPLYMLIAQSLIQAMPITVVG
jgi:hypothetical protein